MHWYTDNYCVQINEEHPSLRPRYDEKGRKISGADPPETGTLAGTTDTETLKEAGKPGESPIFAPPPISGQHKIENAQADAPQEKKRKRKRKVLWLLIAAVTLIILAIALGVGLGVGLTRNKSSR